MTQSFDELKRYAIADILSVSGKDKATRVIENHMNNLIEIALIKGAQSKQAEIDELRKRIDGLIGELKKANDTIRCKSNYSMKWGNNQ